MAAQIISDKERNFQMFLRAEKEVMYCVKITDGKVRKRENTVIEISKSKDSRDYVEALVEQFTNTKKDASFQLYLNFTPGKKLCETFERGTRVTIKFLNRNFAKTAAAKKRLLLLHGQVPLSIMTEADVQNLVQDIFDLGYETMRMIMNFTKKPEESLERYLALGKRGNATARGRKRTHTPSTPGSSGAQPLASCDSEDDDSPKSPKRSWQKTNK